MPLRRFRTPIYGLLLSLGCSTWGCATLSLPEFGQKSVGTTAELMAQGADAERRSQWDQARWAYQHAVQQQPGSAEAWHRLAVASTWQADHQTAAHAYNQALELNPNSAELLSDAGYACYLRQEFTAAEQLLTASIQIEPNHRRANNNLGMLMARQGRMPEALAAFERIHPQPMAYKVVGQLYQQAGDLTQASVCYDYARTLDPQLTFPQLTRPQQSPITSAPSTQLAALPAPAATESTTTAASPSAMALVPQQAAALAPSPAAPQRMAALESSASVGPSNSTATPRSVVVDGPQLIPAAPPVSSVETTSFILPDGAESQSPTAPALFPPPAVMNPAISTPANVPVGTPALAPATSPAAIPAESPGWQPRQPATSALAEPLIPLVQSQSRTATATAATAVTAASREAVNSPNQGSVQPLAIVQPGWQSPAATSGWGMTITARVPLPTPTSRTAVAPEVIDAVPGQLSAPPPPLAVPVEGPPAVLSRRPIESHPIDPDRSLPSISTPANSTPTKSAGGHSTERTSALSGLQQRQPAGQVRLVQRGQNPDAEPPIDAALALQNRDTPDEELVTTLTFQSATLLDDVCLVALTDERELKPVSPACTVQAQGRKFAFSSTEAAQKFRLAPTRYLPAAGGLDVVDVHSGSAVLTGQLSHAAWYRGRLYLFRSTEHLAQFCDQPLHFHRERPAHLLVSTDLDQ